MEQLNRGIAECDELLSQNEMFLARTKGIGAVSAEDALEFGITGPALRASGVAEDVRISEPYSIYDRFDFGIPVGTYGDCWDRYYVRMEEMRQSMRIIEQAMAQMEEGPITANVRRIAPARQRARSTYAPNRRAATSPSSSSATAQTSPTA